MGETPVFSRWTYRRFERCEYLKFKNLFLGSFLVDVYVFIVTMDLEIHEFVYFYQAILKVDICY